MINKLDRLLKLSIAIFFYVFHKLFSGIAFIIKKSLPSTLVIITYHSVTKEQSNKFAKQMNILLKMGEPIRLELLRPQHNNKNYFAVTFDDGYQSVIENALPILQDRGIPATFFVPTGALGKKPPWVKDINHPFAKETVLTAEELQTLPKDIITIGSHTVTHGKLSNIDEDIFRREISESKRQLELILGNTIKLISVPYGTFDRKYAGLFENEAYERVFLNTPTFPTSRVDLYIMGRISVHPNDWPIEYRLKLQGAYQWLPVAISLKNKLLGRSFT